MTGKVVNLRQARKRRARAEKERRAEENRIRFGRTKAERRLTAAEQEKHVRHVDGHRREGDGE